MVISWAKKWGGAQSIVGPPPVPMPLGCIRYHEGAKLLTLADALYLYIVSGQKQTFLHCT